MLFTKLGSVQLAVPTRIRPIPTSNRFAVLKRATTSSPYTKRDHSRARVNARSVRARPRSSCSRASGSAAVGDRGARSPAKASAPASTCRRRRRPPVGRAQKGAVTTCHPERTRASHPPEPATPRSGQMQPKWCGPQLLVPFPPSHRILWCPARLSRHSWLW